MALLNIPQHKDFAAFVELMRVEHRVEKQLGVEHQDCGQSKDMSKCGFIEYRNTNLDVELGVSQAWQSHCSNWLLEETA